MCWERCVFCLHVVFYRHIYYLFYESSFFSAHISRLLHRYFCQIYLEPINQGLFICFELKCISICIGILGLLLQILKILDLVSSLWKMQMEQKADCNLWVNQSCHKKTLSEMQIRWSSWDDVLLAENWFTLIWWRSSCIRPPAGPSFAKASSAQLLMRGQSLLI